jgi:serine/threonine protein kinase
MSASANLISGFAQVVLRSRFSVGGEPYTIAKLIRRMDAGTWAAAKGLLADVAGLPASERRPYIRERCHDPVLRQKLLQLVADPAALSGLFALPALAPGTRIGVYIVDTLLGRGGMGEVYRARDTKLRRDVALKVLPSAFAADHERLARLEREARLLASLSHPNIAHVYGLEESNDVRALVMELVEGETLADRLKKGALLLDDALKIAIEIADALGAAHRHGIVHRDLKPANVMLTKGGAKLLDFGLAKAGAEARSAAGLSMLPTTTPDLTAQGTILGTFQYMAPEQLEEQEADARTDIFAFGAVLYEMFTGRKAFDAKTQAGLIHGIMGIEPPLISSIQILSPPALDQSVRRCLAKAPDERWQSAADLYRELKWIAETSAASFPPRITHSQTGAGLGWIAAAVLLAALVTTQVSNRFSASPGGAGRGPLKVAVFYPDPMRTGPAYEDGAIQLSGFQVQPH